MHGLNEARRRSRRFNQVWCALDLFGAVLGGRLAAAISYYAFFACFGLALLAYSVLGYLIRYNEAVFSAVNEFLEVNLPWLEPATIAGSSGKVGVIGLVGFVITGVAWIEAIRSSQRLIHGVKQQPGDLITRRIVDLVILVGLFVLLAGSLAVAYALETLVEWLAGGPSLALTVVGWILSVGVNVVLASALLGGVPRVRLPLRRLMPVVVFVAAGITLLNTLGQRVVAAAEANPAYQLVTGAVGLLVYLFLFNQLLLLGACLIATSPHGSVRDLAAGRGEAAAAQDSRAEADDASTGDGSSAGDGSPETDGSPAGDGVKLGGSGARLTARRDGYG
jgi:membrane protein